MGTCCYCGTKFPKTRSTRKYCTPRCKTNACLDRKPRRIRSADVQALYELLEAECSSAESLRERLREILAPDAPPIPLEGDRVFIPRLDWKPPQKEKGRRFTGALPGWVLRTSPLRFIRTIHRQLYLLPHEFPADPQQASPPWR